MGYILTNKIEVIGGEIVNTSIAFPDTSANLAVFASWSDWGTWIENNKVVNGENNITLPETSGTICYESNFSVESIENMNVILIETI